MAKVLDIIKQYTTSELLRKLAVRIHSRLSGVLGKRFRKIIAVTGSCNRRDKVASRNYVISASSKRESVGTRGKFNDHESGENAHLYNSVDSGLQ